MSFEAGNYDVVVVGAGHAGCEAAHATASLGFKTAIFAINLDSIGNMPCNPSIGGTSKGQLVREIDALGGIMGKIADKTTLQSKLLNKAKGPAVYSLRAQIDRRHYQIEMKHCLELCENLDVKQGEIVDILTEQGEGENTPHVTGVVTHTGGIYRCKSVILCTGTYLQGRIIIGDVSYSGGPDGLFPANKLTARLIDLGFTVKRLKTGTPARIKRSSVDFSVMEKQEGDSPASPFSYDTEKVIYDELPVYLTHTTLETKDIIMKNIDKSPMFNGSITGVGPRYCPSIETKVMRFSDKDKHQAFVEPCGKDTEEMYLQGMSSSLPEDVQVEFMKTITGLENVVVMRPAYAIEYDAIDATQLQTSLESRICGGLFCAGQINGSSGYEEAAGQGLMAGINAAMKLKGEKPVIIDRSEGYIGVLIDDLVTMESEEPYRMMTSRAEYRLLLRHDNADTRLMKKGHDIGLVSDKTYEHFLKKQEIIEKTIDFLTEISAPGSKLVNEFLGKYESTALNNGTSLRDLLKRPELTLEAVLTLYYLMKGEEVELLENAPLSSVFKKFFSDEIENFGVRTVSDIIDEVEILVKYEGYIKRQESQILQFKKLENMTLSKDIDYNEIGTLSLEAREKLSSIKPESIGQASRISGVSPSDVTALVVYLKVQNKDK